MANGLSRTRPWRWIGWGGAALLLAAPFVAMRITPEMNWGAGDFLFAGILLAIAGGLAELGVRLSPRWDYRAAFGLAILGMCMVVFVSLAVGIVGSEDHPANLWFFAILLAAAGASLAVRFRAGAMARIMLATALALVAAVLAGQIGPTDEPWVPAWREIAGTSLFALVFAASGALFSRSARLGGRQS